MRRRHRPIEIQPQRAVAGPQHLRRIERHRAEHEAAGDGTREAPWNGRVKRPFDQRGRAHGANAQRRRDEAEPDQRAVVDEIQRRHLGCADDVGRADDCLGGQRRRESGGEDGADIGERIGADDELESVEGARQRSAESRRDRASRSAPDKHAQILPAQMHVESQLRGEAGADLRVARLESRRMRRSRSTSLSARRPAGCLSATSGRRAARWLRPDRQRGAVFSARARRRPSQAQARPASARRRRRAARRAERR